MTKRPSLDCYLGGWSNGAEDRAAIARTVSSIAGVCAELSNIIASGPLAGNLAEVVGDNSDGDAQKALDVRAHALFVEALRDTPVAVIGSEESPEPIPLTEGAPLAVAIDPLDGSSNIDTNVSIGTIFSILPMAGAANGSTESALLQLGRRQLAAGFVIYGDRKSTR